MIQETVDRKDLSTSSSTIEGECPEERMIRKTSAATVRQDTQEVRTPSLSVSSDMLTIWTFRTCTPSQSEIFSQSYCSYGVSFQDLHTLPKWNILSKLVHCREIKRYKNTPAHLKLSVFSGSRNWRRRRRWTNWNIAKWGGAQEPKMWRNSTERVQPQERTRRRQLNLNWSLQRKSPQRR